MKLYNTLTQKKETFKSLQQGSVGMYVCGPTVYDVGHLGHARSAVAFDLIRRYLVYKCYKVTFVSNITDVDDKIIRRAAELGISESELTARIIPEYEKNYGALGVLPPDKQPRATEYIAQMAAFTERLLAQKAAYVTEDGVYFEVAKYPEYGRLSHKKLAELKAGARIAADEKKKNPEDFALWKKEKPDEPAWNGPAGMRGRPGWHIECSAMSTEILGESFDIHGGGIDLVFPHHENERAQSEMAAGRSPFARFWLHNGHVRVNDEKMSKSLGNFFTIQEILAQWDPAVVRYFLLSTHYRMPIEFSDELLRQAAQSLSRLRDFYRRVNCGASQAAGMPNPKVAARIRQFQKDFEAAMDDDFNISEALAALFELVKEINARLDACEIDDAGVALVHSVLRNYDAQIFAVLQDNVKTDDEVIRLIGERNAARAAKDFRLADEIRKNLLKQGIQLEDGPSGTTWKRLLEQ